MISVLFLEDRSVFLNAPPRWSQNKRTRVFASVAHECVCVWRRSGHVFTSKYRPVAKLPIKGQAANQRALGRDLALRPELRLHRAKKTKRARATVRTHSHFFFLFFAGGGWEGGGVVSAVTGVMRCSLITKLLRSNKLAKGFIKITACLA